jgi:hypothetical protein
MPDNEEYEYDDESPDPNEIGAAVEQQLDMLDDGESHQDDEAPGQPVVEEAPGPDLIELDGLQLRPEEASALKEFYEFAQENPQAMAGIDAYLSGDYVLTPAQQAQQMQAQQAPPNGNGYEPDEEDDWDDEDIPPGVRARLDQMQAQMAQQQQVLISQQHVAQTAQQRAANEDIEMAASAYGDRRGLSEEEMSDLQNATGRLGVLPALVAKHNGNRIAALDEAFELAYWQTPEFRDREITRQAETSTKDRQRTTKAGKLSGSSGSQPREPQTPRTAEANREAMIAEIAQSMNE